MSLEMPVVIIGLGATGLSCARYLKAHHVPFVLVDSRATPPNLDVWQREFSDCRGIFGNIDADLLKSSRYLLVSPGVSLEQEAVAAAIAAGVQVKSDVDLLREASSSRFIAITGSNGKSTVTTLMGEMARAAGLDVEVGGNIGVPVLDILLRRQIQKKQPDFYILELSSFQLERSGPLAAEVATILNVTADHMDRYDGMDSYQAAKIRVYAGARVAVFNRHDERTQPASGQKAVRISVGLDVAEDGDFGLRRHDDEVYLARGDDLWLPVKELRLQGRHNQLNALAALAMGDAAGFPRQAMLETLRVFSGLHHRCEVVGEVNGVVYINDSKGTNEGATLAAVQGLGDPERHNLIVIVGGDDKGQNFVELQAMLPQYAKAAVLIGIAKGKLRVLLQGRLPLVFAETMEEAVQRAADLATAGDTVLLSPACASLDMFKNYEHRGEEFCRAVRSLGGGSV